MATKNAVFFFMPGGQDGLNLIVPTDSPSVTAIQGFRQNGVANAPDFTSSIVTIGSGTFGSTSLTVASSTGIVVGMIVYGESIPASRALTVTAIVGNTITISGQSYITFNTQELIFKTATQLFKLKDTTSGRNLTANFTQKFVTDTFNVENVVGNANKVKTSIITSIGPLRKKLYKEPGNTPLRLVGSGNLAQPNDYHALLASHNSQQFVWQTCTVEATVGAGGRIADFLSLNIPSPKNKNLTSVSVFNPELYAVGKTLDPFTISPAGLVTRTPGFGGVFHREESQSLIDQMNDIVLQAMTVVPPNDDFSLSSVGANTTLREYQTVLLTSQEITDPPPGNQIFNFNGSISINARTYLSYIKPILRMLQVNNPNRGFNITRSGNVATLETEVTNGLANRVAGTNTVTITSANHRLFTSSNNSSNFSDSVIILTAGAVIDSNISANGYKITLNPSDVNNKFTFTSTDIGALVDVPVTIRLKHNYATTNKLYFSNTAFDSSFPVEGHQVTSIVNPTSLTVTTTASGAYTPTTIFSKVKVINVPTQIQMLSTPGLEWDSHGQANHSQIAAFELGMRYFWEVASRLEDAEIISYTGTEFGRTVSTNSRGTDHGWSTTVYVSGKMIKSRNVLGQVTNYVQPTEDFGLDAAGEIPTISHYQYHATIAKWLGLTDAQILEAFPDLINWPLNERTLDFINP